ncbi:MAG: hypothetical protein CMF62_12535 [Magnetococcales bacterium]|nr:hypothetical protein [Magnetococcales bacterium]
MQHEADLVIVGGGLVGMLTALEAQRAGLDVCLVDKNFSKSGDHAPSVLVSMGIPGVVNPIFNYSLKQWAALAESVDEPIGLNRNGVGFVSLSEVQTNQFEGVANTKAEFTLLKTPEDMAKALNVPQVGNIHSLLMESDGFHIYSSMTHDALRRDLVKGGARVFGSDAVAELLIDNEKVVGIKTKDDEIRAKHVALCAGAWTGKLLKQFGLNLPMRPARSHRIELSVTGEMPKQPLMYLLREGNILIRPMRNGRVLVVYTGLSDDNQATWSTHVDHPTVKGVVSAVARILPALANAKVQEVEASPLAVTPDMLPYLGRVASMEGLYVAAGMNSQTFMYAPAVAKSVALLVKGEAPEIDLTPFSPDRYILKDLTAQAAAAAANGDDQESEVEAALRAELEGLDPAEIERQIAASIAERKARYEAGNLKDQGQKLVDKDGHVEYAKVKDDTTAGE